MPKFGIMLYLVPNLAPCIAFAKFNAKFGIALENLFYVKMPNFSIGTQIWHCIGDALNRASNVKYSIFTFFSAKFGIGIGICIGDGLIQCQICVPMSKFGILA